MSFIPERSRREILCLAASAAAATAAPATSQRPNILLIYTDDHSHRTLSCYKEAYPWVRTPAFDRLAAQGVRFTAAYNGAWCMPARATLLTGRHTFGIESMRMDGEYPGSSYDPEKCPFWPKVFRNNGYFTAHIGKWHTGADTGYGRDWDFQLVWNRPKFPETNQNYYFDQPITYHGGKTEVLKRYTTDQYTDWAIDLIKGKDRPQDKPWFLWLCYGAVHSPYQPAPRHRNELAGVDIETPKDIFGPRPGKPDWAQKINEWEKDALGRPVGGKKSLNEWVRVYHQGVIALDEAVARLMTVLEETGQRENTLVLFTSDQGLAFGQHGFRGNKVAPYDANIRSPLIFSMPGRIPMGKVCEVPVSGPDLVSTMFRFAGIREPWEMHGRDLSPLLKDPNARWPHPAMMVSTGHTFGSNTRVTPAEDAYQRGVPWYVLLRDKQYKYIRPLVPEREELYDIRRDPEELDNLAIKPDYQTVLARMRAAMLSELRRTKAPFLDTMPQPKV